MIKNLANKKKKKAFTLVEVIIVLAIIAIIAAIAIPNLTKVREKAKTDADLQTCETITRTVNLLLTDGTIPEETEFIAIELTGTPATVAATVEYSGTDPSNKADIKSTIEQYLEAVKAPQGKGAKSYLATISTAGKVTTAIVKE